MTFGHVSAFTPRSHHPEEPLSLEYPPSGHGDDDRYEPHHVRPLQTSRRDNYHPEYASMQARVEDEDEDGPPPPPPVHRSWTQPVQAAQSPVAQPPSPYQPYIPGYHNNKPSVPASLVAGYENDQDMNDRSVLESRRPRSASSHYEDEMMIPPSPRIAPSYPQESSAPSPYESAIYPLRISPQSMDDRPRGGSVSFDNRVVTRKSVSPRPSISSEHGSSATPFSPDSYNSLNPNASRSAINRDPTPMYDSPGQARDAAIRAEIEPVRNLDQPIIGDDGREIDPSDHLPTDTWAPEPERKNRKPEVIIRFKHSTRPTSRGSDSRPTSRGNDATPRNLPRVGFRSETVPYGSDRVRYAASYAGDPVERTPRGQDIYTRGYGTPISTDRPRSSRGSVSPSPSARSPLYEYSNGPPVPSKVPINQGPSYPVAHAENPGMDALSRELKTIDLGSVGCSPSRAVRKFAPARASATMGYAS
ncbi:hypothetical protein N7495_009345 [Penicillium taxi]|uniref:uncharacterized protein n=1 Tax=Penicillium taxi TaxID=168475 RepID=UPI0025455EE5|nr:uncharacterized protein N7495_009345 [Penicillium taxi]KAJ5884835.1 hypothetical protein N7495_009345 [Penicillium taxi]